MVTEDEFQAHIANVTDEQLTRIRAFITALRSGNFQKGTNMLTGVFPDGTQKDCCLGVACKVAIGQGLPLQTQLVSLTKVEYATFGDLQNEGFAGGLLPSSVADWYGFLGTNPAFFPAGVSTYAEATPAATLNDGWGWTHSDIADAIERTYITPNLGRDTTEQDG